MAKETQTTEDSHHISSIKITKVASHSQEMAVTKIKVVVANSSLSNNNHNYGVRIPLMVNLGWCINCVTKLVTWLKSTGLPPNQPTFSKTGPSKSHDW
ncbi:hypothetical protein PanWU01x14_150830 [Parasponia andersonii]|uniref:Uncharacterized protein n=1 Tax=Parasponia andersonii TaxID=3476 RepID=A0A2P5CI54_PARAD|nr:hypothetical protein PanWU01x14_150830 [Parasponia andersonii]